MNGIILTLALSLMISDLNQTAHFTAKGYQELNPLARPFVQSKSSVGEVGLGMIGASALLISHKYDSKIIPLLMIAGHGWAVAHNASLGWKDGIVIMPIVYTWRLD